MWCNVSDSSEEPVPNWMPDTYDPTASLIDRVQAIGKIEANLDFDSKSPDEYVEIRVQDDQKNMQIVGPPTELQETDESLHLYCGYSPDEYKWLITVPKQDSEPASLTRPQSADPIGILGSKPPTTLEPIDVRVFKVDADRFKEENGSWI